jgi:hypothetical protein
VKASDLKFVRLERYTTINDAIWNLMMDSKLCNTGMYSELSYTPGWSVRVRVRLLACFLLDCSTIVVFFVRWLLVVCYFFAIFPSFSLGSKWRLCDVRHCCESI